MSGFRKIIAVIVFFLCFNLANLYADFEFNGGILLGWNNFGEYMDFGFLANFNLGYTTADIVTRRALWDGSIEKVKKFNNNDFDILFDFGVGMPFFQAGVLFNYYLFDLGYYSRIIFGIGAGGGWALGLLGRDDTLFDHGPYFRFNIPILFDESPFILGLSFDYYLFTKNYMQIGGYFKFIF